MNTEAPNTLLDSDEAVVLTWLTPYLIDHCSAWFDAVDMPSDHQTVLDHIQKHDMLNQHWQELWESAQPSCTTAHVLVTRGGDGQLTGLVFVEQDNDRYMHIPLGAIGWIAVSPSHRGQGVAHKLMRQADDWFASHGVRAVEVFVSHWNTSAQSLYARHGFVARDNRMLRSLP